MKSKMVMKMLAYMMAASVMTTTVAGGMIVWPMEIMAEETNVIDVTGAYTFNQTSEWDNNKGKENNLSLTTAEVPAVGTTLHMDILLPGDSVPTFSNIMKPVGILRIGDNRNWVQSNNMPELKAEDFNQEVTIEGKKYYKATVAIEFGETVGANDASGWNGSMAFEDAVTEKVSAVTVQFAGYLCDYSGDIVIANARLVEPEDDQRELTPMDPTVVADFASGIEGWAGDAGWDYSHGKDEPEKNSGTPVEKAVAEWDETTHRMKMILDYSKDTASGWSEAKVTGAFEPVSLSNYNMVTFQLTYPSAMETVRTKLFMSDGQSEILNAEGSFRSKTVKNLGNGWSTATIRGQFKPQDTQVSGLTIGIVGPYADLNCVYIDDVTFGQLDASEDYVAITEAVDNEADRVSLTQLPSEITLVDSKATDSTKALAAYLQGVRKEDKVLFGHQNSTFRSVRDNGVTSDVKDVTGSEAGVFGIDTLALAGSEASSENPMGASVAASKKAYENGSIVTLSCHMPNFTNSKIKATGNQEHPYDFSSCDFQEAKDLTPCADFILEGGEFNGQYNAYLDIIAEYALELQKENVPILFRPFHENSGGWFWWGTSTSVDSYKAIWRYMVNYLQDKGVHNLLYVYSPNGPISSEEDYLARFPGDEYVDVLGFDYYDDYSDVSTYTGDAFFEAFSTSCSVVSGLADKKKKIPAIAETGIRITGAGADSLIVTGNPTTGHDWYNKVVNTAVENDIPYFLLWANFSSGNFFIPYKYNDTMGQEMINEFICSYNNDHSIFGNGTNFYNNILTIVNGVTAHGYSDEVGGYLISPKNYMVIKDACELTASVKNASKVQFVIRTSEQDTNPVVIDGEKAANGNIYIGQLTDQLLKEIAPTGTGTITVVAYQEGKEEGKVLGIAQFINFNQDAPTMPAKIFDNFEYYYGNNGLLQNKYGAHNSAAGCSSSVELDAENKVEGDYGCAFTYELKYNGSEAWTGGMGREFDTTDFSAYNAVSMWVRPDGNGQKMVVQLKDSKGKEYEVHLSEFVKGTKAQYVTIPFSSFIVKGGTEAIDASDIVGCYFWCNTLPENISEDKKDSNGKYTVNGKIVFDDIRAVKISESDLSKANSESKYIVSDQKLGDLSEATNNGNHGGSGNVPSGSNTPSTPSKEPEKTETSNDSVATETTETTETTTITNSSNKEMVVTTITTKDADGNIIGITEKSVIKNAAKNTNVTVTIKKDENGKITSASSSVTKTVESGNKVTISKSVISQIAEAAGTKDVKVTVTLKDANANTKFKLKLDATDLVKGNKLKIYQLNSKTGEYVMINAKTYTVNENGNVSVSMIEKKTYELMTESEAHKINKQIVATVKPAKTTATIKPGKSTTIKLDKGLNMDNVKKITYSSASKSVVKVDKNGKVTAKKAGTAKVKVTVTLKNGTKKTVSMKVKVK